MNETYDETYDVASYSDAEIYDILDLSNPSDRELEAKILHMIWRYESFGERGSHLVRFFEDIYDRFFEESQLEGFAMMEGDTKSTETTTTMPVQQSGSTVADNSGNEKSITGEKEKVNYNFTLDYTKDQLNPLLKSTTKRVISIDSQFRPTTDKVSQLATDFTFNLSTPLKDVVNLKMNSVQIPFTWYTINKNFGSNFFYLKGAAPGIDGGNYDISFTIGSGNYSASALVDEVSSSIQKFKDTRTDISLGDTNITYNGAGSQATIKLDLKNTYSENYYELHFSNLNTDKTSIPSFLGFNQQTYYPFRIYGAINTNTTTATVVDANKTITIQYYVGNNILQTIAVSLTIGATFTRNSLIVALNSLFGLEQKLLSSSQFFYDSSLSRCAMDVRLNRNKIGIVPHAKLRVLFPNDNAIWVGSQSLLGFPYQTMEFGDIISENNVSNESIVINDNPYILFDCSANPYNSPLNDISFAVTNTTTPYTLKQYIDNINSKFVDQGQFAVGATRVEIQSDQRLKISVELSRTMETADYTMTLDSSSILKQIFKFGTTPLTSQTTVIDASFAIQSSYQITSNLMTLEAKPATASYGVDYNVVSSNTNVYYNLPELASAITSQIQGYQDMDGDYVLRNATLTLVLSSIYVNTVEARLTIRVDKVLRPNKYKMVFVDNSREATWLISDASNSWGWNLKIDQEIVDLSIGYSGGKTDVSFATVIETDTIEFSDASNNNRIYIRPISSDGANGIYAYNDANTRTIYFGTGVTLTRNEIFKKINDAFQLPGQTVDLSDPSSGITVRTTGVSDYTNISLYVNRTYTTKDYTLVFYDPFSFVTCSVGNSSVRNTTWDATLGWILGFRKQTEYSFTGDTETITGDTVVSVNIYSYFMIVLDDYNLNRMTDGIVTTTQQSTDIALPSYANRTMIQCDPGNGSRTIATSVLTNTGRKNLTQNQVSAVNANLTAAGFKKYTTGAFTKDVLAIIPLKLTGLPNNSVYVINGSDLAGQERSYFGPVNLQRMTVKLVNDKGETVDLNGADWSMTLLCEQMYNQK
jgi:hypothetical protein